MRRPRLFPLILSAAAVCAVLAVLFLAPGRRGVAGVAASRGPATRNAMPAASAPVGAEEGAASDPRQDLTADRRLVRTGALEIEVDAYAAAAERAVSIATSRGGYLADSRASREPGDRRRGTLTLRVAAAQFDAVFRELKALGRVETATVETEDVTRAYADLETRLAVKRAAQVRLSEILRTRTGSLADLVVAERELTRLVEEAERLEGERRAMASQVALATITLSLFEPAAFLRDGAVAPLTEALREALPLLSRSAAAMLYAAAAALPWVLTALLAWTIRKRLSIRRVIRLASAGD